MVLRPNLLFSYVLMSNKTENLASPFGCVIVGAPHVDDNVAFCEELRLPRSHDRGAGKLWQHPEHDAREHLVAVECAVVGADLDGLDHFERRGGGQEHTPYKIHARNLRKCRKP